MLQWLSSGALTRRTGSGRSPRCGPSATGTGAGPPTSSTPPRGGGRRAVQRRRPLGNEHQVSILVWDMLDSAEAKATHASAHVLTWAIGLLLLGNCDFAALRRARGPQTQVAGALVVSLLAIEGANGANLNPLVLS